MEDTNLFHKEPGIKWRNAKGYELIRKGEGSLGEFHRRDTGTFTWSEQRQ